MKIFSSRFEQNQADMQVSAILKLFERLSSQMKFLGICSNWGGGNLNYFREEQFESVLAL